MSHALSISQISLLLRNKNSNITTEHETFKTRTIDNVGRDEKSLCQIACRTVPDYSGPIAVCGSWAKHLRQAYQPSLAVRLMPDLRPRSSLHNTQTLFHMDRHSSIQEAASPMSHTQCNSIQEHIARPIPRCPLPWHNNLGELEGNHPAPAAASCWTNIPLGTDSMCCLLLTLDRSILLDKAMV